MLLCPRLLHRFIIGIDVMGLMAKLAQIAGVKASVAEQTFEADLHLLPIGLFSQTWVLGIEPIQEFRIIRVKDKKTHTYSPLHGISNDRLLPMVRRKTGFICLCPRLISYAAFRDVGTEF